MDLGHIFLNDLINITSNRLCTFQDIKIECEVLDYYRNLVGTDKQELQHVDIVALGKNSQLNEEHRESLTKSVTSSEIWSALKSIGEMKAPGMDGYTSKFFKSTWRITGRDVTSAVQDFFESNCLFATANCALITLILKNSKTKRIKDTHPIACCSSIYKVISKILTMRLSRIIHVMIDKSQYAFIPGRLFLDNIMLLQELMRGYSRKNISPRCAIQMDIHKAYNTVELSALENIMREMNFPKQFICWTLLRVQPASYMYNINGCTTEPLKARRGLWQGDHIPPCFLC